MIITLVVDSYEDCSNGITMTTRRLAEILVKHGHQVQILAGEVKNGVEGIIPYELGIRKTPILYQISKSQGFFFAKRKKSIIKEAVLKSDLVHFLLPFKIERYAKKICDMYEIPTTAAFHLQPENITSTLKLNNRLCNGIIYRAFRRFYNRFENVHCPSIMIRDQLVDHNYKSNLYVISNGVAPHFVKKDMVRKIDFKNKFVILMIGRLSSEKRQDLIIEAVKNSKYEKNIQIVFAGKGPLKSYYEQLGKGLTNKIMFKFFTTEELVNVINMTDLYIHASDAEIEAISCIEAFSCGAVPIISDSPLCATKQFALDERNLFKQGNSQDLMQKIEYWYENEEEKRKRSNEYIEYARRFSLEDCVSQLEEVFEKTVEESKTKKANFNN